jgi:hypothetical protein
MTTYSVSASTTSSTSPITSSKVTNGRAGHPNDRRLGDIVGWLIADLKAVDQLRRGELRKLRTLRHEVYGNAREVGVSPTLLRALAGLTHSPAKQVGGRPTRTNGKGT